MPVNATVPYDVAVASERFDKFGMKCPWPAHIRKMNPRGDRVVAEKDETLPWATLMTMQREMERQFLVTRRGMPYDDRAARRGVGLLFMSFQASIHDQFSVLQKAWANSANHARLGTGLDPLIGHAKSGDVQAQKWPKTWGGDKATQEESFPFGGCVTFKGGEFFFAPSIAFLDSLCGTPGAGALRR